MQVVYQAADNVKFTELKETSLTYKLLSLAWVNSRTVIFIDMSEHAHVVDVQTMDELEVVDLADIDFAYNTSLGKSLGNSTMVGRALSKAGDHLCCESVASFGGQLIILGLTGVHVFSVRTWIERLNVLVRRRQFDVALSLARSFYDRAGSSCSDGPSGRQAKRREAVAERIVELLAKYVDHVDAVSSLCIDENNTNDLYHVCIPVFMYHRLKLMSVSLADSNRV